MTHEITIRANCHAFVGLGKQNMLFHQCACELLDNAIAAAKPGEKARAAISLAADPEDPHFAKVCFLDWSRGMDLGGLSDALQLGGVPSSGCRLNEHGFGMKNALSAMASQGGSWELATHRPGEPFLVVRSPFRERMEAEEREDYSLPPWVVSPETAPFSTAILVRTPMSFLQTVRKGKATDLATLRGWLMEHLGVAYRGYLELDPATVEPSAKIVVSMGGDHIPVPPVPVPMDFAQQADFQVELGGELVDLRYRYGVLSPCQRDRLVRGSRARYYYQGNIPTQGIDVRLGKRVIATAQLEAVWKAGDGTGGVIRHNSFNDFVGELLIPDLPRGILGTVNNKTSFDLSDPDWEKIFEKLRELAPPPRTRKDTEESLKQQWMGYLRATNPEDNITDEYAVWPTGVYIDVLQEKADGRLWLYELKTKAAEPLNLYQLKMYWDGLVLAGREPEEAVLIAKSHATAMEQMARQMNGMEPPRLPDGKPSRPYRFRLATHAEKCLGMGE